MRKGQVFHSTPHQYPQNTLSSFQGVSRLTGELGEEVSRTGPAIWPGHPDLTVKPNSNPSREVPAHGCREHLDTPARLHARTYSDESEPYQVKANRICSPPLGGQHPRDSNTLASMTTVVVGPRVGEPYRNRMETLPEGNKNSTQCFISEVSSLFPGPGPRPGRGGCCLSRKCCSGSLRRCILFPTQACVFQKYHPSPHTH